MNNLRNILPLLYDFYIVATEKNFSKAAKSNLVSQSNLSRSVQNLENDLKLKLINSSNKGIELTSDGEKLYQKLDEMFSNYNQFTTPYIGNEITGILTIGTTRNISDYKLLKYLLIFNKYYPNVKIKIFTDNAKNLNEYLMQHKIDILIDYLPHINYSENLETEVISIGEFHTCFACSKKTYQKIKDSIHSLRDLNQFNLVIPGNSRRRQLLDEVLQLNNIQLDPKILMPDSKLMADFVLNTDYIGYFVKDEIKGMDLIELSLKEMMPINAIGLIYLKNTINNIAKKFVDMVLNNF